MKAGEIIKCPHCGEKTVVKLEKILSGWQVTGEKFVCAFCAAELVQEEEEQKSSSSSAARDKLAAFLGGDNVKKVAIDPGEGFRKGCRNRANLLEHPFKLLCALTQQEVDPMHECPAFIDREKKQKSEKKNI